MDGCVVDIDGAVAITTGATTTVVTSAIVLAVFHAFHAFQLQYAVLPTTIVADNPLESEKNTGLFIVYAYKLPLCMIAQLFGIIV
jgi:hypothetical protein